MQSILIMNAVTTGETKNWPALWKETSRSEVSFFFLALHRQSSRPSYYHSHVWKLLVCIPEMQPKVKEQTASLQQADGCLADLGAKGN